MTAVPKAMEREEDQKIKKNNNKNPRICCLAAPGSMVV
jgi:hypothetical protein